jgi:hypothetical protein
MTTPLKKMLIGAVLLIVITLLLVLFMRKPVTPENPTWIQQLENDLEDAKQEAEDAKQELVDFGIPISISKAAEAEKASRAHMIMMMTNVEMQTDEHELMQRELDNLEMSFRKESEVARTELQRLKARVPITELKVSSGEKALESARVLLKAESDLRNSKNETGGKMLEEVEKATKSYSIDLKCAILANDEVTCGCEQLKLDNILEGVDFADMTYGKAVSRLRKLGYKGRITQEKFRDSSATKKNRSNKCGSITLYTESKTNNSNLMMQPRLG